MLRLLLSVCWLALLPGTAVAHVFQISAKELPGLVNQAPEPYSFFSMQNGRLEPVPHQWLAFSDDGFPWFTKDSATQRSGKAGVINQTDRLLLRRSDGGPRLSGTPAEQVVAEVQVTISGDTLYYYVVRNAYRQATQRYVRFDRQRMQVRSTDYSLSMDQRNMLI
jgi:hypothetical protein